MRRTARRQGPALRFEAVFDRSGSVARPPVRGLAAEIRAHAAWRPARPDPALLPSGGGSPVLVIPAFLTGDAFTAGLRAFLDRCGFRTAGWGLGVNLGPTPRVLAGLRARLDAIHRDAGRPVALVGISLGGTLARDLAHERPEAVRRVATLGSPIALPTASPLEPLFRPLFPFYARGLDLERLARTPPVPCTAIWTRRDGIVAPRSCAPAGEDAVEVDGTHTTLSRHPEVLSVLVRRLAPGDAAAG